MAYSPKFDGGDSGGGKKPPEERESSMRLMNAIRIAWVILILTILIFIFTGNAAERLDGESATLPVKKEGRFQRVLDEGRSPRITIYRDTETGCLYFHSGNPLLTANGKPDC